LVSDTFYRDSSGSLNPFVQKSQNLTSCHTLRIKRLSKVSPTLKKRNFKVLLLQFFICFTPYISEYAHCPGLDQLDTDYR
jgi:hypothetical protein